MSTPTRRDIADQLVAACAARGTAHAFGMPGGGSNLDVAGACDHHGVRFVLCHTETGAAIMAAVAGDLTATPGICVATRGPGAASAVNGVATALVDRQPLVMVTDCVAAGEAARVSHQRIDQQELFGPITLASVVLDGVDSTVADQVVALTEGFPPGPVHVDLDPTAGSPAPVAAPRRETGADNARLLDVVRAARRPILVVGTGAVVGPLGDRAAVTEAVRTLGERANVPVLTTYKARGVVGDSASYSAGIVTGATIEGAALAAADLIIGIGLDPVEFLPTAWQHAAPVVLIGSWPVDDGSYTRSAFFGDRLAAESVGDLAALTLVVCDAVVSEWSAGEGRAMREAAVQRVLSAVSSQPPRGLTPQQVVVEANDVAPAGSIATVDAGAHMLVTLPLWEVEHPGEVVISSGYATMGYALPAAIGASVSRPGTPVVCFTGDGGLGIVMGELETLARLQLPVVVVVFNDATLSLIAIKQKEEGHGGERAVRFSSTDYAAIAAGFGIASWRVDDQASYRSALETALASRAPALIDVTVDPSSYPAIMDAIRG